jgi:hypothetical protein
VEIARLLLIRPQTQKPAILPVRRLSVGRAESAKGDPALLSGHLRESRLHQRSGRIALRAQVAPVVGVQTVVAMMHAPIALVVTAGAGQVLQTDRPQRLVALVPQLLQIGLAVVAAPVALEAGDVLIARAVVIPRAHPQEQIHRGQVKVAAGRAKSGLLPQQSLEPLEQLNKRAESINIARSLKRAPRFFCTLRPRHSPLLRSRLAP